MSSQHRRIAVDRLLGRGLSLHLAGRPAEAEQVLRELLDLHPNHPDAWHLLGLVAFGQNRFAEAVARIGRAIAIRGDAAPYHYDLGNALDALGRLDEARESYETATRLRPDHAEAHAKLGQAARLRGDFAAAATSYAEASRLMPRSAPILAGFASVLRQLGRTDEAIPMQLRVAELRPDAAESHYNLANSLLGAKRFEDACARYRTALRLRPDFAEAALNLGIALRGLDRRGDAIEAFRRALRLRPAYPEALLSIGNLLASAGRPDEALDRFDDALRIDPGLARAHSSRGNALAEIGRHEDAARAYASAIRLAPNSAEAHSNRLWSLHYDPRAEGTRELAHAREFAARFETGEPPSFDSSADGERRLRIGYVSADLGDHAVGRFLLPVLRAHRGEQVEVFCYSNREMSDDTATALRARASHWRDISGSSDLAASELIRRDRIDVLVDLSGHTALNRLPVFAMRSAPVQLTWMGYWSTTGLRRMDRILSDATTIRPDEEHLYSERVVRLPNARFCYAPDPLPDIAKAGRSADRPPTFGSFNNLAKIGPEVVALWARVLRAVPGATLLLKWKSLDAEPSRRRLIDLFAASGVDRTRLELRGASPYPDMLAEYAELDVALDPFPFSGGITTCDALSMGVPVVTMPGARPASRQAAGFLRAIGLDDWIAGTSDDYVRIAADAVGDREGLVALRPALRNRLASSVLCDAEGFTRDLEAAYRDAWRDRCRSP